MPEKVWNMIKKTLKQINILLKDIVRGNQNSIHNVFDCRRDENGYDRASGERTLKWFLDKGWRKLTKVEFLFYVL